MIISILASILITLGAAALGYLVVKGIAITLSWLKNKIAEKMKKKHTDIFIVNQRKIREQMAKAIRDEIEKNGTCTMTLDDLDGILEDDGVIMASINDQNEIDADTVEIFTSNDMDEKTKQLFRTKGDVIKIASK